MTDYSTPAAVPLELSNVSLTVRNQARLFPDAIALVTHEARWRYQELEQHIERYAQLLFESGIHAEDRVALIISDERVLLMALLAAARLSAPVLLIPRSTTASQRNQWMTSADVRFLVTDTPDDLKNSTRSVIIKTQWLDSARPTSREKTKPKTDFDAHQTIFVIAIGSGSTGRPKLMPITHAQMSSRALRLSESLGVTAQDRLGTMAHMEYVGGIHRLLAALFCGAGFVLLDELRDQWRHWHSRYGLTILAATAFHARQMLNEARNTSIQDSRPLDGIRLSVSSSVITQELRERILVELCGDLRVNYATNEAHLVSVAHTTDLLRHPGTVGHPLPSVIVKIVDDEFRPLPAGHTGLIVIQSDQVITGYLDDEEATEKAFHEGWFIPGDMGRFTDDGQLIFCGRSDNMMIFNGINIFPIEIEQCLLSHPDVLDVVAMPTRHAIHQDVPVAIVALQKDAVTTEGVLRQYAAAALGPKQPRRVVIAPEIPRNRQGKPIKQELTKILSHALSNTDRLPLNSQNHQTVISFSPRSEVASQQVAAWLRVLTGDQTEIKQPKLVEELEVIEATQWLKQVLALAVALLQVARIPVFDSITVFDCSPEKNKTKKWKAICQLPDPKLLPVNSMNALVREAFKLADWVCTADIESLAQRQDFFERIESGALKILTSARTRGKSTFEVLRVAHSLSIPYQPLAGGVFQLGWGRNARRIDRSTTDRDSTMGMRWANNKIHTAQLLRESGLPTPVHGGASSSTQAQELARRIGYPVVVKPSDLERGEAVALDVQDDGIEAAFQIAFEKSPSKSVLIERQIPGVCHRLFIAAGELLYAVKRLPMGVYGDGFSSISALVSAECDAQLQRPPWLRSSIQPLDAIALNILRHQGWEPHDIPQAGQFVALRRIETTASGGVDEEVTLMLHPDNVRAGIRATRLLGLEVAGVDIISQDITQPWYANGAVINEVNYAPLLGGGDISRRHIKEYLSRILKDNGRIPLYIMVGGEDAWTRGMTQWRDLIAKGVQAYLTDEERTLDAQGQSCRMATHSLNDRVQGLLMELDVGALVIVARSAHDARSIRAISPWINWREVVAPLI